MPTSGGNRDKTGEVGPKNQVRRRVLCSYCLYMTWNFLVLHELHERWSCDGVHPLPKGNVLEVHIHL